MKRVDQFIDKSLDIFFSKDKTKIWVILILLLGIILRVIAAINLGVYADDTHFAVHAINFLKSGKLITYDQSSGLWYFITDIFYNLFGVTQFVSRFASVLFGSATIILMYLFSKKFFNEKIALISAFLVAISPYAIKGMMSEMDSTAVFFILFSLLFFVDAIRKDKIGLFATSAALLGVSIMVKVYGILFIPGFLVFYLYLHKKAKKKINKRFITNCIVFLAIIFIFTTPTLIHNYLLFKDKGIMDLQFTRVFGFGKDKAAKFYSWDAGWNAHFNWTWVFLKNADNPQNVPNLLNSLRFVFYSSPIIFTLSLVGLVWLFKKRREYFNLFFIIFLIPWIYLSAVILLPKHFLFILILLIPSAATSIFMISKKTKIKTIYILALLLIFSLVFLGIKTDNINGPYYSKSSIGQVMDFSKENIQQNSLVVVDSRIYRGRLSWMFNNHHYLEASYFPDLFDIQPGLPGEARNMDIYFVECVKDDCGWGNVGFELNETMEHMLNAFVTRADYSQTIESMDKEGFCFPGYCEKEEYYKIHHVKIPFKDASLRQADATHTFFLYPLKYDEFSTPIFDKYETPDFSDKMLNKFGFLITYFAIILAFLFIFILVYIFVIN